MESSNLPQAPAREVSVGLPGVIPNQQPFVTGMSLAPQRRSSTIGKLVAALAKAQGQIEGASKDKTNPHFKSQYADLASVWGACRAALSANELAVIQTCRADGGKVTVGTTLAHSSGEWISEDLTMTAQQATPQAIGSAITYARRYALAAMVGVAPEDDDGNEASGKGANGHGRAVATALEPTRLDGIPQGAARITAVEASGDKPWRAKVAYSGGDEHQVTIFSESVRDLAVQVAQDGDHVVPTINKQGQMTKLKRWTDAGQPEPTVTAADIPF